MNEDLLFGTRARVLHLYTMTSTLVVAVMLGAAAADMLVPLSSLEGSLPDEVFHMPTAREFWTVNVEHWRPLMVRGAVASVPAIRKWTKEYLTRTFGDEQVRVGPAKEDGLQAHSVRSMSLRKLMEVSAAGSNICAVSSLPVSMATDLEVPPFMLCGSLVGTAEGEADPRDGPQQTHGWVTPFEEVRLSVSYRDTSSRIRIEETNTVECLVSGEKEWVLLDTRKGHQRLPWARGNIDGLNARGVPRVSGSDFVELDPLKLDAAKLSNVSLKKITQRAGDCIFVPFAYAHQVTQREANPAISVSLTFGGDVTFDARTCSAAPTSVPLPLKLVTPTWSYSGRGIIPFGTPALHKIRDQLSTMVKLGVARGASGADHAAFREIVHSKEASSNARTAFSSYRGDAWFTALDADADGIITDEEVRSTPRDLLRRLALEWQSGWLDGSGEYFPPTPEMLEDRNRQLASLETGYAEMMRALHHPTAVARLLESIDANRINETAIRCKDRGPWLVTAEGGAKRVVTCAELSTNGHCNRTFAQVWTKPPAGVSATSAKRIREFCPASCDSCTATCEAMGAASWTAASPIAAAAATGAAANAAIRIDKGPGSSDTSTATPIPRYASLNTSCFEDLVISGVPFIVTDATERTQGWGMHGWDCKYFADTFPDATILTQYTGDDGTYSTMANGVLNKNVPSNCPDSNGPQLGPQYWGIKEAADSSGRSGDGHTEVGAEQKPHLKKVRAATKLPYFMNNTVSIDDLLQSPEVWLSKPKAGAQAHADGHCESTISIQLSGVKRWRLSPMPMDGRPMHPEKDTFVFYDGGPYRYPGGWVVSHIGELHPGEALIMPPGFIHESLVTSDVCAASITYQFSTPLAARYWDEQLPAIRRQWDTAECPSTFATLYELFLEEEGKRKLRMRIGGLLPADAKRQAISRHALFDKDSNGCLSLEELRLAARTELPFEWKRREPDASVHVARQRMFDRDSDGCLSASEVSERVERYVLMERIVSEEYLVGARKILQSRERHGGSPESSLDRKDGGVAGESGEDEEDEEDEDQEDDEEDDEENDSEDERDD